MPIEIPDSIVSRATDAAVDESARRLNLRKEQVTATMRSEVSTSVKKVLQDEFATVVQDAARASASELLPGPDLQTRLSSKLAAGAQMVNFVSADAQYLDILDKNAKMQRSKFDAYVAAGFTDEQAFRLLETELLGKAGARGLR